MINSPSPPVTLGLEPAKVSVTQCSKTDATWSITAPEDRAVQHTSLQLLSATSSDFVRAARRVDGYWTITQRAAAPPARHRTPPQFCSAILLRELSLHRDVSHYPSSLCSSRSTPPARRRRARTASTCTAASSGRVAHVPQLGGEGGVDDDLGLHLTFWTVMPAIPLDPLDRLRIQGTLKDSTGARCSACRSTWRSRRRRAPTSRRTSATRRCRTFSAYHRRPRGWRSVGRSSTSTTCRRSVGCDRHAESGV